MSNNNLEERNSRKAVSLKDLAIGQSVVGYVKEFFKNPKSQTPDAENIVLVTKTGEELVVWASGTLNYMRERMQKAGVSEGVLTKITRIDRPESTKKGSRQKYFADILFKKDDTKTFEASSGSRAAKTDDEGFSEF